MARYGQAFKNKVLAKLLPPSSATLEQISQEMGVSIGTLERWRAEALSTPARERAWSASARLSAVITTAAMDEAARSALRVTTFRANLRVTTFLRDARGLLLDREELVMAMARGSKLVKWLDVPGGPVGIGQAAFVTGHLGHWGAGRHDGD